MTFLFLVHTWFFSANILTMKLIELKVGDFPIVIKLNLSNETREYLLVKTKQDKLLLNRAIEAVPRPSMQP